MAPLCQTTYYLVYCWKLTIDCLLQYFCTIICIYYIIIVVYYTNSITSTSTELFCLFVCSWIPSINYSQITDLVISDHTGHAGVA